MNRRELKRDIKVVAGTVIEDCYEFLVLNPSADHEEVKNIIEDSIDLHDEMIDRVNHPDGKDNPKVIKAYFTQVKLDFYEQITSLFSRLEKLLTDMGKEVAK